MRCISVSVNAQVSSASFDEVQHLASPPGPLERRRNLGTRLPNTLPFLRDMHLVWTYLTWCAPYRGHASGESGQGCPTLHPPSPWHGHSAAKEEKTLWLTITPRFQVPTKLSALAQMGGGLVKQDKIASKSYTQLLSARICLNRRHLPKRRKQTPEIRTCQKEGLLRRNSL